MSTNALVIVGSARKNSDTRKFVDAIFEGMDYDLVDLLDFSIAGYDYSHKYAEHDKYAHIVEKFLNHQAIFFATPVYWYSMSSLMKTLFDRFSDLVTYQKATGRKLKGKSTFLIAVGAEELLPEGFEVPFRCTSEYLDMEYRGSVYHCTKSELGEASIHELRRKISSGF